ncbi:endonuclease/exonuclease/phosphatase family protein [candidate division CSSED10-310 bacterium]|uniref:Endonuclease/exonuclease/phosphatase family protein n=1 Tax=candidate division CSSED10-310 bacterium TaxID=2855610 RepID=A0ABV6YZT4_UNCC1
MTEYFLAWWNLENLFDVEDSPHRPEWLQSRLSKELKGWDENILDKKLNQLVSVLSRMNNNQGPDLLGVCEVENKVVLDKLVQKLSPLNRNYGTVHHDTSYLRGIDVAFIYDQDKFSSGRQFYYVVLKRSATRDIVQENFKFKQSGNSLIVFGNHWPSRSAGEYESEPYRILAAETLSYWIEQLKEFKGHDIPIIIMGDFNDQPFNRSLTEYALSTNSAVKVKNSRIHRLFNLMWPLLGAAQGTFFYNNFPLMIDQFLISKGFLKSDSPLHIKHDSVKIESYPEMSATGKYHYPIRFGRPSSKLNTAGFSDHFPISICITEKDYNFD